MQQDTTALTGKVTVIDTIPYDPATCTLHDHTCTSTINDLSAESGSRNLDHDLASIAHDMSIAAIVIIMVLIVFIFIATRK